MNIELFINNVANKMTFKVRMLKFKQFYLIFNLFLIRYIDIRFQSALPAYLLRGYGYKTVRMCWPEKTSFN